MEADLKALESGFAPEPASPVERKPKATSSWRRSRAELFTVYHALFAVSLTANAIAMVVLLVCGKGSRDTLLNDLATAAAANILVAILMRQDYVVNLLFHTCILVPLRAPVGLRHRLALIYENGGLHSGCATSSLMWFVAFTVYLTIEQAKGNLKSAPVLALDYILVVALSAIVLSALPQIRAAYHNVFENVHRLAGWSALGIFWIELVLFALNKATSSLGLTLVRMPAFWMLLIASLHSVYPWIFLRKVYFTPEKLSDHAVRLHHNMDLPRFRGLAISESPLREWHPFASFPNRKTGGGSLIISNAGDWTRKTIDSPRPYYYVKGFPKTGVLTMATIFRRVVVVTTGSGIGPCLGVLADMPAGSCRLIWSTPAPMTTFGSDIIDGVKEIDSDAIIHDTRVLGRPDLLRMVEDLYRSCDAEAICVWPCLGFIVGKGTMLTAHPRHLRVNCESPFGLAAPQIKSGCMETIRAHRGDRRRLKGVGAGRAKGTQ